MQLYEWEGQGMLSAFTQEFCGLRLHLIHLLFYWHWLGVEETHAKMRLPVKILTKEGNGHWLRGSCSAFLAELPTPLQSCCRFAGCLGCLSSTERSLLLAQGQQWVAAVASGLSDGCDHARTISAARSIQSGSDHSEESSSWTTAVSLGVCLLTPQPKGNQEWSERGFCLHHVPITRP